jgi:NitT/TauT family transport system ATP-binding protein
MIELDNLSFAFVRRSWREEVTTRVLDGISLELGAGEFVAVTGPSGCGKTTLLRLVAGLLRPTGGAVRVDGLPVGAPGPDRVIVFQDAALLPWLSAARNVALGLELSGRLRGAEAEAAALDQLAAVGLADVADRRPSELSGGMRQRVGLARALAVAPRMLLLDEPFAALDEPQRLALGADLVSLWRRSHPTILFVTHSIEEAVTLADRAIVLRAGRVAADLDVRAARPRSTGDEHVAHAVAEIRAVLRGMKRVAA